MRALQARETLLDIRKWIAKAWLVEKCSSQKMNWFKKLRFFNLKEGEFLSFEGEALEPAGMVLPTIEMRPVQRTHHDYGTEGQVRTMQAIIRQELQVPYNGPPVFSSHPEPTVPGRTTSFVGGGAAFAGAKPHDYAHYKIKPFGDSDALLFGRPWKVPAPPPQVHQALHTQGSAGAHSMHASVPPTPATPNTPKWSPKVEKWYLMTTISPEGSAAGSMGSNKRGEGGIQKRPQSASAMLRRMSVVQRPLDEYLSHRPGYQPAQEEETRTMADYLMENERNSTVIPNRNPRARFHSARQIRTLNMQVDELAQRTEEALSLQVVHAPGKTVKERNWTVKAILKTPDIVDNLHLEGDGTVKYQDAETANSGAFTSRSWRPSSARPHRIPIPNYLLHDHE